MGIGQNIALHGSGYQPNAPVLVCVSVLTPDGSYQPVFAQLQISDPNGNIFPTMPSLLFDVVGFLESLSGEGIELHLWAQDSIGASPVYQFTVQPSAGFSFGFTNPVVPMIEPDKPITVPGDTVTLAGAGFQPGTGVQISIIKIDTPVAVPDFSLPQIVLSAIADGTGKWSEKIPIDSRFSTGGTYLVIAQDLTTGGYSNIVDPFVNNLQVDTLGNIIPLPGQIVSLIPALPLPVLGQNFQRKSLFWDSPAFTGIGTPVDVGAKITVHAASPSFLVSGYAPPAAIIISQDAPPMFGIATVSGWLIPLFPNLNGSFSADVPTDMLAKNTQYNIWAQDLFARSPYYTFKTTGTTKPVPQISVSPIAPSQGQQAVVSGSGFTPNGAVNVVWTPAITLGAPTITLNEKADSQGNLNVSLTIDPHAQPGVWTVQATDIATSMQSNSVLVTILISVGGGGPCSGGPLLITSVLPPVVMQGASITVTGVCNSPNGQVELDSTPVAAPGGSVSSKTVFADANGNFTVSVAIAPTTVPGLWSVTAKDLASAGRVSPPVLYTVSGSPPPCLVPPVILANPPIVAQGASITVTGIGFTAAGEVNIVIDVGSGHKIFSTVADSQGHISTTITIDSSIPTGAGSLQATDVAKNCASLSVLLTVTGVGPPGPVPAPVIFVTPPIVAAGGELTILGTGFTVNAKANVVLQALNNQQVAVQNDIATDANGSFTAQLTVPANTAIGSVLEVVAKDQTTDKVTLPALITVASAAGGLNWLEQLYEDLYLDYKAFATQYFPGLPVLPDLLVLLGILKVRAG